MQKKNKAYFNDPFPLLRLRLRSGVTGFSSGFGFPGILMNCKATATSTAKIKMRIFLIITHSQYFLISLRNYILQSAAQADGFAFNMGIVHLIADQQDAGKGRIFGA